MKKKLLLLLFISVIAFSISAKNENKQPESYNYQRGVELFQAEKYDDAEAWFNKEIASSPENGYAYYYLSVIYAENNEQGKALTAMDKSIKYLPKKDKIWRSYAYAHRADIYSQIGDTVQAFSDLAQAIKIDPTVPEGYRIRADLYFNQGKYALSDADYQKMIDIDKGDVRGYLGIGRNAKKQGQYEKALSQYNLAIKLIPNNSLQYSIRAEIYLAQEEWALAADDIIKALSIDLDRYAFYELQNSIPEDGYEIFISKLKIQMTKEPSNYLWPYCLGIIYESIENYEDAIVYYEKSNSLNANSVILRNLAQCYYETGDYEQALSNVDRSLDMDDEDANTIKLKADMLSYWGRYDECLKERDKYVSIEPEDAAGYYYRADDNLNARKYKNAVDDFNTAVLLYPDLNQIPYFLTHRGDAYRFLGKTKEASDDYNQVIKLEADSVSRPFTPFAYSGLGNAEKAIEAINYVLESDTTDISGNLYNVACIYARLGMKEDAIKKLKESIANGYDNIIHILDDYDMDNLSDMPEFNDLI